jgi:multidrug efflux system membrane fusion protein
MGAAGCGGSSETSAADASVLGVTVHAVKRESLRDIARGAGTVVPSAAGDWTIFAPEPAEIVELAKTEGEAVTTGDLLVRFEIASRTQEMAALELQAVAAEQALERAAADLKRQTELAERGIVSRQAFETARAAHASAQTTAGQARAQLEGARAGQDTSVVRARFSGTVVKVWRTKGDLVSGGPTDPVMRVVDPSRIQISVQLPIVQLARVNPGQQATVRPLTSPTDEPATVITKAEGFDSTASTGEVRLALINPVALPLDSPASVELLLDVRSGVLAVPTAAIKAGELGPYVMVAGDDGLAHRRDVRVGLAAGELTQIISGLEDGELVITSGLTEDSVNMPVSIVR